MKLMPLAIAISLSGITACSKKDTEENKLDAGLFTGGASFLTKDDIAYPTSGVDEISSTDINSKLNDSSFYYFNHPNTADTLTLCIYRALSETTKVTAIENGFYWLAEGDVKDCAATAYGSQFTVNSASAKIYTTGGCSTSKDYSTLNGDTYHEVVASNPAKLCDSFYIEKFEMELKVDANFGESNYKQVAKTFYGTKELGDASITISEGKGTHSANNFFSYVSSIEDVSASTKEYDVIQFGVSDLVQNMDNTSDYFDSGNLSSFKFNNWSGTISYTGASSAPVYTLNDGTTDATGSLSGSSSLSLHAESFKKAVLKFEN